MAIAATELMPIAIRVPERTFKNDLRAMRIVWHRDVIRFWRDRPRMMASLLQPVLYLFVFGTGMASMIPSARGVDLKTFLFPGVLSMSVLFTCFFSAGSMVWDREFGFMREMLVAPVRRWSIVVGKCLGGATAGAVQGVLVIALAGLVGVPYAPGLLLKLFAELMLLSFSITALGVLVAIRIRTIQSFMAIVQMLIMPLFFLSGALYPLTGLPTWLEILTRLDPLTYVVDPMRREVFAALGRTVAGVTWGGVVVPISAELGVVAACAAVALAIATVQFSKGE